MPDKILSNRYLLDEEIGTGGMGSVYRATDLRTGGHVAVKIPHAHLAKNTEYVERLRREAQIAASLYSPRIVRVMDLDTSDGLPFLVMEYVPGETLADELTAQGRLDPEEALTIGLEIARALDAAHTKGIVHRDLKPANIKLIDGEVKVLDFGIAKAEGFAGVTAVDMFMGTPEYSAPERADGLGDIRSDMYSLGVLLYEVLTGALPFTAPTPIGILRKHEQETPSPLPDDVPSQVTEIVMRCMAKRPEDRYATPRELVTAMATALRSLGHTPAITDENRARPPSPVAGTIRARREDLAAPAQVASAGPPAPSAPRAAVAIPEPPAERQQNGPTAAPAPAVAAAESKPGAKHRWLLIAGVAALGVVAVLVAITLMSRGNDEPVVAGPAARPPVVATIPTEGKSADEQAVISALNEANKAQIAAFRNVDPTGLDASFTGAALADTVSTVNGSLKRQGRYAIADLTKIELVDLSFPAPGQAVARTRETLDYDEYSLGSKERVPGAGYIATQLWTYHFVKQGDRWLMEKMDQPVQESYVTR